MKEKISCSLDGKSIAIIDKVLSKYPIFNSRSAVIDFAVDFMDDLAEYEGVFNSANLVVFMEKRFSDDGQKESKN